MRRTTNRPTSKSTLGERRFPPIAPRFGRRRLLRTAGVVALGLGAGCLGTASAPAPTLDHPAAADLSSQPWLGDREPEDGRIVIVFEDPSCPVCHAFEERTFPKLRRTLIDAGRVAFVSRGFPAAQPWGRQGLPLLEATFARDEAAFWGLRAYLFDHQGQVYSDETLYATARAYLENQTDLAADRIVRGAEAGRYDAAVEHDERAAHEAGVRGTPTFFLFEAGSYLTKIEGAPSYSLLTNAMGM